jgi:ribosomal protein S18 acetylase RimI-like enzyme
MKKLLTEWRQFLKESQEFVEMDSPLTYNRAGNVKRLALRDPSIEPPYRGDFGFADQYSYRNPRTGRMTKKRHLEAPGAGDDIVGFLDFHDMGETSTGKSYFYIDYMKTRREHKEQGIATKLLDEFIRRYAPEPSIINFGKIQNPGMYSIYEKIKEKYPEHNISGGKNFR